MKTLFGIALLLKFISIFLAIGTLLMTCNAQNDEFKEIEKTKYGLENSHKGFLRIKIKVGGGSRVKTINAYGYIEGVDSTNVDTRRVVIGIGEVYSKDFENKFEGDLIPIWYDENKDFVYARVYKTSKETVNELVNSAKKSKNIYRMVNLILVLLPFIFYFLQKLTYKPEYD